MTEQHTHKWLILVAVASALLMGTVGSVVGIAITLVTRVILKETAPGLTVLISPQWVFHSIWLALAGAGAGALFPAFRAARCDPVDALAYE